MLHVGTAEASRSEVKNPNLKAREKLNLFIHELKDIKVHSELWKQKESQIMIAYQILLMESLHESAEMYEKLDSDIFRIQFSEYGELSEARMLLLNGDIDGSLNAVTVYLEKLHTQIH